MFSVYRGCAFINNGNHILKIAMIMMMLMGVFVSVRMFMLMVMAVFSIMMFMI